jgi:hypothetical protein
VHSGANVVQEENDGQAQRDSNACGDNQCGEPAASAFRRWLPNDRGGHADTFLL